MLPALTADLIGLRQQPARPAVIGAAIAVARRRPLTALGVLALLGVDPAPEWVVLTGTLLLGCGRRPRLRPSGARRASGELPVSVDHFRLCFDNSGRLVAKNVIPAGRPASTPVHRCGVPR
ncbi:hypothetical protein PGH47_24135 [Streptomyces sp. HUAS 31]|uniref:hypothetical protein n=1 Tax=Streptomyces sp. HUAS 31 TaxID=3020055 RepID=UPI002305B8A3|nr:hypothetical protein [Streptomyces sp. HUAS 31]WCD98584.1 hypothetical protein PGH47_24135 [Streptomyces sp. HUAS 31]